MHQFPQFLSFCSVFAVLLFLVLEVSIVSSTQIVLQHQLQANPLVVCSNEFRADLKSFFIGGPGADFARDEVESQFFFWFLRVTESSSCFFSLLMIFLFAGRTLCNVYSFSSFGISLSKR